MSIDQRLMILAIVFMAIGVFIFACVAIYLMIGSIKHYHLIGDTWNFMGSLIATSFISGVVLLVFGTIIYKLIKG